MIRLHSTDVPCSRHELCLEVINKELFLKVKDLDPTNVAAVINAAARLPKMRSGVLVTSLADKIAVEGRYYSLESVCLVTAGLSVLLQRIPALKTRIPSLFETLGRRVGELSLQLRPRQVAGLVYAFARVSLSALSLISLTQF